MVLARTSGSSGSLFEVSGEVANNATWQEVIYFMEDGTPMVLTDLSFKMTFRCSGSRDSADYTLSTDAGTLAVDADADSGIENNLYINVPAGSLTALCGDYICDLASRDINGVVTPWANGIVSFRPNPVAF